MIRRSRLALAVASVVLAPLAACSTAEPVAAQSPPPKTAQRDVTPRAKLPRAIVPLLPRNGIYAAGGGLVSTPWRIVVDLDAKTLFVGSSSAAGASSFGKLEKEQTKELSPRNGAHLMNLAHAAWVEPAPTQPLDPVADYDEVLVVLEGEDTFYLEGYGPIRRPDAAKTIVELRAAAGL